jgi:hypothetical protein
VVDAGTAVVEAAAARSAKHSSSGYSKEGSEEPCSPWAASGEEEMAGGRYSAGHWANLHLAKIWSPKGSGWIGS